MFHFLAQDKWDFFHTHIMGTDRINHFLLRQYLEDHAEFAPAFRRYYRKIDSLLGRLLEAIGQETPLIILSDHGFSPIRYEVQLSRYLAERGWTRPLEEVKNPLSFDPADTKAFALIPGRIYVNVRGRDESGCVPAEEYHSVRQAVAQDLRELRDPGGRPVIRAVLKREEIYWPKGASGPDPTASDPHGLPPYSNAPDLLAIPYDGYDLKLGLTAREIFINTQLEGMHTYHDALLLGRNVSLPSGDFELRRLAGLILETLGVQPSEEMDLQPIPPPAGVM